MGRTTRDVSRPGFVADPNSISRNTGRTVDWPDLPASRENDDGDLELTAGLAVSFTPNGLIPRADTEFALTNLTTDGTGTATATTDGDHNYEVGDTVTVTGTSNYDGTYEVTAVPSSNEFSYDLGADPADEGSGTSFIEAKGLLASNAEENSRVDSLSGYGVIVGGVIYETLLPESLTAAVKSELQDHSTGFAFETYEDTR